MNLDRYLDVSPEVKAAIEAGKPVVALESTIISHGMPYPQNLDFGRKVEQIIRDNPPQWLWFQKRWNTKPEQQKTGKHHTVRGQDEQK